MIRFLAALVLACFTSPALAAATDPVTWGAVASIAGWIGLGLIALVAVGIILVIIIAAIGGFNDWSH